MAFPRRAHADPASIWLRTLIAEIADRLPQALGLEARRMTAGRRPAIAARDRPRGEHARARRRTSEPRAAAPVRRAR
jgi:hypothetical protein